MIIPKRTVPVLILLLLFGGILAVPVPAATSQVHVVKYAGDGTTVLAERTLTYQEMRDTLPVLGDGITHYYHEGPVFADDPDEAAEQQLRWNPNEDANVLEKDMGAVMGTNVRDLCDLVGGMKEGDTVELRSSDGWTREFAYENIYEYSSREGPMVLTWYSDFDSDPATPGEYADSGYSDGMRIVWLADDGVNPWGVHAFGNQDWHEAASSPYWYYFISGAERYPTTTGLSGKSIAEIRIHSNNAVPPVAAFSALPQTGSCPLSVQFTDQSTGTGISARAWDFQNDGVVDSDERNPSFVYTVPGTYSVALVISTPDASDEVVKSGYITVTDPAGHPPVARFSGDPVLGELPLTVQFTDSSSLNPTSWAWDFGDGATSDLQSPDHTYTEEGTYTVTLTAANDYGSDRGTKVNYVTARSFRWGPYLSATTTTGTVVNARTYIPAAMTVEYATDAYYQAHGGYDRHATGQAGTDLHHIALTGLDHDTRYHYRVIAGPLATGDLTFRTFAESGPFTFIVYSDTQDQLPAFSQLERHKLVADRIAQEADVRFVLNSGDLVNDALNPADWDRYFAAGGAMMANLTVFPARGNHDNSDAAWSAAYGLPATYSFDYGEGHFAILDSNAGADLHAQDAWLAEDLRTAGPFRFVSFHHPPYSSDPRHFGGFLDIREAWEGTLTANDVLAVFNGHVHAYERFVVGGINYFVEGTGGAPSYTLQTPRAEGSAYSRENMIGYTRVTVDPVTGNATAEVIPVADVSGGVVTLSPPDTVIETVVMSLNAGPVVDSVNLPLEPRLVHTDIPATAWFRDPGDTHTAEWDWGDGSISTGIIDEQTGSESSGAVTGTHSYTRQGVYPVTVTLTDHWGAVASNSWKYLVVYTPDTNEVSGRGFITSPPGAYLPDPAIDGKAGFGLTAKYTRGVPVGNARITLHEGMTRFTASYLDWIINRDGKAMIHGYGSLGKADGYSFLLIVTDGTLTGGPDTCRIIIWDPAGDWLNNRISPLYDSGSGPVLEPAGCPISGGSIRLMEK